VPHRETLVADAGRNPDTMRGIAAALSLAEMSLGKGIYCTLYYTIPDISLYLEGRDVARYGSYLMTDPLHMSGTQTTLARYKLPQASSRVSE
jgi:hypothetical protein